MRDARQTCMPIIQNDAYNSVGEHLRNDHKQQNMTVMAAILAGLLCSLLVLAVILN